MTKDVTEILPDCDSEKIRESFEMLIQDFQKRSYDHVRDCVTLGKAFERSLISPQILVVPPSVPLHDGSSLPEWFYELFCVLFHEDGLRAYSFEQSRHITEQSAIYVLILRQIFLAFSKLVDLEPDISVDDEIRAFIERITSKPNIKLDSTILLVARLLLRAFSVGTEDEEDHPYAAPFAQWVDNPFGKHGPGAVAEKEEGVQKWFFGTIPGTDIRLFNYYEPCEEYVTAQRCDKSTTVDCTSRLAVVPKDLRGHRLICIEPKELMFAQQGLMQVLYQRVKELFLTRGAINFQDQGKSQELSKEDGFSTIDLKDASDRVSKTLCRLLFPKQVFSLLSKYRSRGIRTVLGDVDAYETMFTMGNALCFPTETLVFWALTLATMICEENDYSAQRSLREALDVIHHPRSRHFRARYTLRVFGDDIIVPSRHYEAVIATLTDAGLVVNVAKSCHYTPVREACGSWWFQRRDVRITRFSYHILGDTRVWCSWFANSMELERNGFFTTALMIAGHMNIMHPVPFGYLGLPGHRCNSGSNYRYNTELQREEFYLPTVEYSMEYTPNPGDFGLYAYFTGSATRAMSHGLSQRIKWDWVALQN